MSDFKYITFTGPMAHVYRKYVTTDFNYSKAFNVIKLFKEADAIDLKEKEKLIIMLRVLRDNPDQIEKDFQPLGRKDKMMGSLKIYKKLIEI